MSNALPGTNESCGPGETPRAGASGESTPDHTYGFELRCISDAKAARIQGSVAIAAIIGKDGSVQSERLISGHPSLAPAAMDAVKQWKFRPYLLNGEAIEVDTQVTINFTLALN